jgi:hypothetical protein
LITDAPTKAKVFATCLVTSGLYPSVILQITWLNINTGGFTKRGLTWAAAEMAGQSIAILGTHIYDDPPRYIHGHALNLSFSSFALVTTVAMYFYMARENARKDKVDADYAARGEQHPHALRSLEDEQDRHQNFRYIL